MNALRWMQRMRCNLCLLCIFFAWGILCAPSAGQQISYSEPFFDFSNLIFAVDVTVKHPATYNNEQPFVMFAKDASYASFFPRKKNGRCNKITYALTGANDYSCASVDKNHLIPFECQTPRGSGLTSFTAAQLSSYLTVVPKSEFFVENMTLRETNMQNAADGYTTTSLSSSPSSALHYHYDFASATGFQLYNGECLFETNQTLCETSLYTREYVQDTTLSSRHLKLQPDPRRIHTARVVPYVTIPSIDTFVYHAQYRLVQLIRDCAHMGIVAEPIYSSSTPDATIIGWSYIFAVLYGHVTNRGVDVLYSQTYHVRVFTKPSVGDSSSYSISIVETSDFTIDVDFCSSMKTVYDNDDFTMAHVSVCVKFTFNPTSTSTQTLYGLFANTGSKESNATLLSPSPTNCLDVMVEKIESPFESSFCTGMRCIFFVYLKTKSIAIQDDGMSFLTCDKSTNKRAAHYDLAIHAMQCPVSSTMPCTRTKQPQIFELVASMHVYPPHKQTYDYPLSMSMFLSNASLTTPFFLQHLHNGVVDVVPAAQQDQSDRIILLVYTHDVVQWHNTSDTVVVLDPDSVAFTLHTIRYDTLEEAIHEYDKAHMSAIAWDAFLQTWTMRSRNSTQRFGQSPLLREWYGLDMMELSLERLFRFFQQHLQIWKQVFEVRSISISVQGRVLFGRVWEKQIVLQPTTLSDTQTIDAFQFTTYASSQSTHVRAPRTLSHAPLLLASKNEQKNAKAQFLFIPNMYYTRHEINYLLVLICGSILFFFIWMYYKIQHPIETPKPRIRRITILRRRHRMYPVARLLVS